jgi:hypothetical protein
VQDELRRRGVEKTSGQKESEELEKMCGRNQDEEN